MPTPAHVSLDDWISRDAIAFAVDAPQDAFDAAVDRMMARIGTSVEVLGFGEALHGGEELLVLRNRLFRRLAKAHGFTAIALESSFPRGHVVNEYVNGRGEATSYDGVQEAGFSHGFGKFDTNRDLVEWMRHHNARAAGAVKLHLYGFDSPTEMMGTDSPRQLLAVALDGLAAVDPAQAAERRQRIEGHLGVDADWENPAAMMDPTKSVGLSPAASALRIETEELITELHLRRPDLVAALGEGAYLSAERHATGARQLLTYHAGVARASDDRLPRLLGLRDVMMADNLAHIASREKDRAGGRVFAFAHNSHLKRGKARWQLGPHALEWWPAGAHLHEMLGPRYAVIGSALGVSEASGIGQPEAGTLEARLTVAPGPARFIPTHRGAAVPVETLDAMPVRSGGKNPSYFPLSRESLSDFDWLAVVDSATYTRGAPPVPGS